MKLSIFLPLVHAAGAFFVWETGVPGIFEHVQALEYALLDCFLCVCVCVCVCVTFIGEASGRLNGGSGGL